MFPVVEIARTEGHQCPRGVSEHWFLGLVESQCCYFSAVKAVVPGVCALLLWLIHVLVGSSACSVVFQRTELSGDCQCPETFSCIPQQEGAQHP